MYETFHYLRPSRRLTTAVDRRPAAVKTTSTAFPGPSRWTEGAAELRAHTDKKEDQINSENRMDFHEEYRVGIRLCVTGFHWQDRKLFHGQVVQNVDIKKEQQIIGGHGNSPRPLQNRTSLRSWWGHIGIQERERRWYQEKQAKSVRWTRRRRRYLKRREYANKYRKKRATAIVVFCGHGPNPRSAARRQSLRRWGL